MKIAAPLNALFSTNVDFLITPDDLYKLIAPPRPAAGPALTLASFLINVQPSITPSFPPSAPTNTAPPLLPA